MNCNHIHWQNYILYVYIYIYGYSSISSPTCRCSCVDYVRYTSKAKERKKERKKVNLPVTIFIFNSATEICFWNKKNIVETYTLTWRILWGQIKPKFFQKKQKSLLIVYCTFECLWTKRFLHTICGNKHGKILDIYIYIFHIFYNIAMMFFD